MEPPIGEVFLMPHEHLLLFREAYVSSVIGNDHRRAAPFSSFCLSVASGKDKKMYFDSIEFGKRLQAARKASKMTQQELAESINSDRKHISRLERGKRVCSIDVLIDISVALNVTTDYLLMGKSDTVRDREALLAIIDKLSQIAQKM